MSIDLKVLWEVISPRIGAIASFTLGIATGGMLMSRNFTIQKGDFLFSTKNDEHALQLMKESYNTRVKHMLEKSKHQLATFESEDTTAEARREIVESVIDYYLIPTSHDKLFSKDIVIFNGKGKTTILVREDFDIVKDNWSRVLSTANVKKCIDSHRIGEDYSPYDKDVHKRACSDCLKTLDEYLNTIKKIKK